MSAPADSGRRLLRALPALYAAEDGQGELAHLLGAFEAMLFDGSVDRAHQGADGALPGIERSLFGIADIFLPAEPAQPVFTSKVNERLVRWLATLVGFQPQRLFDPTRLRRIISGLVSKYGQRGTAGYLSDLLQTCFESQLAAVHIDDRPPGGFVLNRAVVGRSTWLRAPPSFHFIVRLSPAPGTVPSARLERDIRAVIDFAKPAHTHYDLEWPPVAMPLL